jgi:predicted MFS family arabinose efflux permease
VAVFSLGAGAGETALLHTVLTLPFLIFAMPAGVLADRWGGARLMAMAEFLRALCLVALLLFIQFQMLSWSALASLGFFAVCATVVFSVAAPALIPLLVPGPLLVPANSRIELARTTAFAGGPALGGLLVGWMGAGAAFAFAAALSLAAASLLLGIHEGRRPEPVSRGVLEDIAQGALYVLNHDLLRPVFVTQFVFSTAFFMLLAIFVPHAVQALGLSASGIGITLGMYGTGMILGALSAPRVISRISFGKVVAIGPYVGLLGSCLMALTIWLPTPLLAGAGFFLLGAGPIIWVISTTTLRQSVTPQAMLGRVSAVNIMSYGARPVGSGVGALIAALYGIEACLFAAVAGFVLQAAVITRSPVVTLYERPSLT